MKKWENWSTQSKTHDDELQKMPQTEDRKFKPDKTSTCTLALVAGWESRLANHHTLRQPIN